MTDIITRFPPSPTGNLHIGNIRTLLFNYLFARKHNGKIVMRFEDTDTERSEERFKTVALETLATLGLDFDEGPYAQSERTDRYVEVLEELIANDKAYRAEESEDVPGESVVRFRNPNKKLTFTDLIRGEITIDTTDFGDFVIARSIDKPLYHLSVVVDDIDMGITHVIRGEDHITSTPRQMLLIEAIGGILPHYAHLPLIVGDDKKKLGKRHGATTWQEFKTLGVLPAALINYLALLGWNPGDDREIFSKDELINEFSLERVNNSPAKFSYDKLGSINKHYLLELPEDEYEGHVRSHVHTADGSEELLAHPRFADIVRMILRERLHRLSDVRTMLHEGEFDWLKGAHVSDVTELIWKKSDQAATERHLVHTLDTLQQVEEWTRETVEAALMPYAEQEGKGDVLWPLRMALTNMQRSPDPFTVAHILGKEETLARLTRTLQLFGS